MESTLGVFPLAFLRDNVTTDVRKYFEFSGRLRFPALAKDKESVRKVKAAKRLRERVHAKDEVFLDLVERMLRVDPRARISAAEAFNHKFFRRCAA
jgi:serine/threonine protein kinase